MWDDDCMTGMIFLSMSIGPGGSIRTGVFGL
jgi:hypothetical protein